MLLPSSIGVSDPSGVFLHPGHLADSLNVGLDSEGMRKSETGDLDIIGKEDDHVDDKRFEAFVIESGDGEELEGGDFDDEEDDDDLSVGHGSMCIKHSFKHFLISWFW